MRTLDEVARDLQWCAPWALGLFQRLLQEYRELLAFHPDESHLAQLRVWEGQAPGPRRSCHPPAVLARPGLDAVVREEVMRRGRRLLERLDGPAAREVSALLGQFELQRPQRRGLDDLPRLLGSLRREGAVVHCQLRSWPLDLPPALSEIAYEIVAEGLRNAIQHGDGSRRALLILELRAGKLRLEIRNPLGSTPFRSQGNGLGLRHLRWRVRSCRGRYRLLQSGQRARLQVRIPLP